MRFLLNFLDEPYAERCLEPFQLRINSSTVPADFKNDGRPASPKLVDEAMQLSTLVVQNPPLLEDSSAAADEMHSVFRQRVKCMATIDNAYQSAQHLIASLRESGPAKRPATTAVL
jgi:hypothetical protein